MGDRGRDSSEMPRVVFAGDREIAVRVLEFLLQQSVRPLALLVSGKERASHDRELAALCPNLGAAEILRGDEFRKQSGIRRLSELMPDYIICVHFPYIFPAEVIAIPGGGVLNLHPAYLPYNRGWHTATWAIWDGTPFGATLHFMSEEVDAGDIIHQKRLAVLPDDAADSLSRRVKKVELEVFEEAWPQIVSGVFCRRPQPPGGATAHRKADIGSIQLIDRDEEVKAGDLLRRLRALTTSDIKESAYFRDGGCKYRLQLKITRDVADS